MSGAAQLPLAHAGFERGHNVQFDNAGNRTGVQEQDGNRVTWSGVHPERSRRDGIYQLTREQRSGSVQERYDVTYTYDEVGNRLTKVEGRYPTTYSYDGANQLGTETYRRDTTTYSYDANGNTQVINAAGSLTTNTWDIENHLTVVQLPAGTRTTATYDGDGKRRRYEDNQDALLRNFSGMGRTSPARPTSTTPPIGTTRSTRRCTANSSPRTVPPFTTTTPWAQPATSPTPARASPTPGTTGLSGLPTPAPAPTPAASGGSAGWAITCSPIPKTIG